MLYILYIIFIIFRYDLNSPGAYDSAHFPSHMWERGSASQKMAKNNPEKLNTIETKHWEIKFQEALNS